MEECERIVEEHERNYKRLTRKRKRLDWITLGVGCLALAAGFLPPVGDWRSGVCWALGGLNLLQGGSGGGNEC
mgnify:FL=1